MANCVLGIFLFAVVVVGDRGGVSGDTCGFPAVYNFGDDNSDTGQIAAAFDNLDLPNGMTFFGKPSGRYCDGRLIIDFITEQLGLPFLSGYLESIGSNFSHGANFAMGGPHVLETLLNQIFQFIQFKSRTTALYNQLTDQSEADRLLKSILPKPEDFSNALYIIDAGHADFTTVVLEPASGNFSGKLGNLSTVITLLHEYEGARFFWIHNAGPVGCSPYLVRFCQLTHIPGCQFDQYGCVKSQNDAAQVYNSQLKDMVSQIRATHPNATFTYVDVYSAKYNLITQAKNLGFEDPMKICCGSFNDQYVACGEREFDGNGTMTGSNTACENPSKYISWDGKHYTEAANQFLAKLIINGSLSDPPISLSEACQKPCLN